MNNHDLIYSASVMCANLRCLENDLKTLETAGCHELHFDVMDGMFVPNLTLGCDLIRAAKAACTLPCSAHLMVTKPEKHIESFVEAGCTSITVHVETCVHVHRLLNHIREAGASPGIAVNPATPLTKLDYLLECADRVLLMAVDPGYSGQKLIKNAFERIKILKENLDYRELRTRIQVEGNINVENAAILANSGATILVLDSSSIFNGPTNLAKALNDFDAALALKRKTAS